MTSAALTAYQQADRRDAALMVTFARAAWTRRGWLMILSGLAGFDRLAGFNRNVTEGN